MTGLKGNFLSFYQELCKCELARHSFDGLTLVVPCSHYILHFHNVLIINQISLRTSLSISSTADYGGLLSRSESSLEHIIAVTASERCSHFACMQWKHQPGSILWDLRLHMDNNAVLTLIKFLGKQYLETELFEWLARMQNFSRVISTGVLNMLVIGQKMSKKWMRGLLYGSPLNSVDNRFCPHILFSDFIPCLQPQFQIMQVYLTTL